MKRYLCRQQAKCNFCSDWFVVFSQIKFGLNICEKCIQKALTTQCFKLPAPDNYLYQVYLVKKHINFRQEYKNEIEKQLFNTLDDFMHKQFKKQIKKWQQIMCIVKKQIKDFQNFDLKTILQKDDQLFQFNKNQIIDQLKLLKTKQNNKQYKQIKDPFSTPLRQKNQNILKSSATNSIKKKNSYNSLKLTSKQNFNSASIKRSICLNLATTNKNQCSPFNLTLSTHRLQTNSDIQEQKQFSTKMNKQKLHISTILQNQQSVNPVMQNIMRQKIYEAIQNTNIMNKCIELVSYQGLQDINFRCYLKSLNWQGVQVIKFVRVSLTDSQLKQMLKQIEDKQIQTIVLTNNNLTEQSLGYLQKASLKKLKNIYLSKNQIFIGKIKGSLKQLKQRYNIYI